ASCWRAAASSPPARSSRPSPLPTCRRASASGCPSSGGATGGSRGYRDAMAKASAPPSKSASAPSVEPPGTTVLVEQAEPGITKLVLNRPERLNAMSHRLTDDLHDALDAVLADRTFRVVDLTGAGRWLCAGLFLAETG